MSAARHKPCGDISLPVEAPLRIDQVASLNWDACTDVLIAGFGAAGSAAALSAREQGLEVTLVDRFDLGGASARSGGVVYAGGGTRQQQKIGVEDSPEAMFNYLRQEVGDAVSAETLRRFCDDSRGLIEWLESLGVGFDAHANPPKTSYPKDGTFLYYSGNEAVSGYREHAQPAPRGHRTVDSGLSGHRLYAVLRAAVLKAGVSLRAPSAAHRLIVDAAERVVGLEVLELAPGSAPERAFRRWTRWAETIHNFAPAAADWFRRKAAEIERQHARTVRVQARRGVVLATGGFVFNREMLAQYSPRFLASMRLGTAGCDGSGIRLGLSAGGVAERMHKVSAWRFINPPSVWPQGVVVDQQGQRFCNEASYGARLGVAMCEAHQGRAWLILDKAQRRRAWREALTGGLWIFQSGPAILLMLFARRAPSIAALAAKLGMPQQALQATIDDYNRAAQQGQGDVLGKDGVALGPIRQPSFAAINISADNPAFPLPAITLGGLKVNEASGVVVNAQGQDIKGLYAVGRSAVGIASNGYVSGLSLADCLWSGRRAGQDLGRL